MATIMPQSELVRRALLFISEKLEENQGCPLMALVEEAGMRFNLGPGDCRALERLLLERKDKKPL